MAASSALAPSTTVLPTASYDLTDSLTTATGVTKATLLDRLETTVRGEIKYQNSQGALIDPVMNREIQYATPYFAYAASVLIANGRGDKTLLRAADSAMDWASRNYAGGVSQIPDQHGEFYIYPLALAYQNLAPLMTPSIRSAWLTRLRTPLADVIQGLEWNWRTYAMKGAWAMYGVGILTRTQAVDFIESSWTGTQKARATANSFSMYEDGTSTPDTIAYDYAARGNLMYLVTAGYDGASAGEIKQTVVQGAKAGLYLVDPTGQAPNTGRSGNHVWNDLVASVTFERESRILAAEGDTAMAAEYHRAAGLSITSTDRWKQSDGLYSVTKNNFPAADKRGYADYSSVTNYNGYMIMHLSELVGEWRDKTPEAPTPAETGGYAVQAPSDYAVAVADAGGMQVLGALQGQTAANYSQYWTQLGLTRVSLADWDSRLGNLSGEDPTTKAAFSLAPALYENGKWVRLAEQSARYQASFSAQTVTPELAVVTMRYTPKSGKTGPIFVQTLTITPDGILMKLSTTASAIGATLPLLANDGNPLAPMLSKTTASTSYGTGDDSLNYMVLDSGDSLSNPGYTIAGATGNYVPVLAKNLNSSSMSIFIYPAKSGEPTAAALASTMKVRGYNFANSLGFTTSSSYVGSSIAGGYGAGIDLNGDGKDDLYFDRPVDWVMHLQNGYVTSVETNSRAVLAIGKRTYKVNPFTVRPFL
ncbi:MAG: hypothetical protein ACTHM6_17945 [Tepidisphaeraceae bacterium]